MALFGTYLWNDPRIFIYIYVLVILVRLSVVFIKGNLT